MKHISNSNPRIDKIVAANSVNNNGIQHDLSEAQHCKCENIYTDNFKLQIELIDVRLELKSEKKS
jgi:hypothetical protein